MQLIYGDCLEKMKDIPDKSIDMVLCDPPYGTTPCKWDTVLDFSRLWEQYHRIVKDNGVILLFGQEPFSSLLRCSNLKDFKYDWYWEKERLTNVFQVKWRPGKTVEVISVFYKKSPCYNPQKTKHEGKLVSNKIGKDARWSETMSTNLKTSQPLEYFDDGFRHPTQILRFNRDNSRKGVHPTQKPVALCEYFIKTYTNEGVIVLDNTMGSGSTGVACVNTNRDFIGIENDKEWFNIAEDRIKEAMKLKGIV